MNEIKTGTKMTVGNLVADKKFLQKYVSPSFIKNRKVGTVEIKHVHTFEDNLYVAKNLLDDTEAIYMIDELSRT